MLIRILTWDPLHISLIVDEERSRLRNKWANGVKLFLFYSLCPFKMAHVEAREGSLRRGKVNCLSCLSSQNSLQFYYIVLMWDYETLYKFHGGREDKWKTFLRHKSSFFFVSVPFGAHKKVLAKNFCNIPFEKIKEWRKF